MTNSWYVRPPPQCVWKRLTSSTFTEWRESIFHTAGKVWAVQVNGGMCSALVVNVGYEDDGNLPHYKRGVSHSGVCSAFVVNGNYNDDVNAHKTPLQSTLFHHPKWLTYWHLSCIVVDDCPSFCLKFAVLLTSPSHIVAEGTLHYLNCYNIMYIRVGRLHCQQPWHNGHLPN